MKAGKEEGRLEGSGDVLQVGCLCVDVLTTVVGREMAR